MVIGYTVDRHLGAASASVTSFPQTTTYTLVEADLGAEITVVVSYYDGNGATENPCAVASWGQYCQHLMTGPR